MFIMLRYSQQEIQEHMARKRELLLEQFSPSSIDQAFTSIASLLFRNDRDLYRAFIGEEGAEPSDWGTLSEAFFVITSFFEEKDAGRMRPISDTEQEVWFRKYLLLPPLVIS